MAVAKFGAIVTDIRGKLGGHVFQGNGLSVSLRTGNSGKGGFMARNDMFKTMSGQITALWNALSEADRAQWGVLGQQYPLQNNLGDQVFLTGQNLHRRNYTAFFASGQTGVIDPYSAIGDLPSSSLQHVQFNFAFQEIDVQFQFDRFSQAIIIYAMPVAKFGLSIQPSKIPFIYGENDETPQDNLLWDAFFAKYPAFTEGSPCWFGVVQVNQFGFKSFVKTVYGTFV